MRFHGGGTAWNHVAMDQAIVDSGLAPDEVSNERTGIIMGSGGPSTRTIVEAADIARTKGPKRVGPFAVPKAMSSTASATLSTWFKIKGLSYSISSACATSNHCIGAAYEHILADRQDVMFAGGCEELDWTLSVLFDAMGAMSSAYNDTPSRASRAYDKNRDGFVISGGAGVLVLEDYERAKARRAKIYGEIVGYGATSDGHDMVAPSGEGAARCMRQALSRVKVPIDYINPHATSTPIGDLKEIEAVREVFGSGDKCPPISATKSLTGHSQGATGAHEAIYSLLMMQNGFISRKRAYRRSRPRFLGYADRAFAPRQRKIEGRCSRTLSALAGQTRRSCSSTSTLELQSLPTCDESRISAPLRPLDLIDERAMRSGLMSGKRGLVMGVANDHSIAWGIAKALASEGAELAFTYQNDALGKRVAPLAQELGAADHVYRCDVEDLASVETMFSELTAAWSSLDFLVHCIGFSDRNELRGRYADTSRENFSRTMVISAFSFTEVAKRAAPLMPSGGAMLTLSFGGSTRVVPNYNVMGVAKAALEASVRYLAADYGPDNIRINAISAGPVRTLAGAGIADARFMFNFQRDHSPLRRTVTIENVGGAAVYLLSNLSEGVTGEVHFVDAGYNIVSMPRPNEINN